MRTASLALLAALLPAAAAAGRLVATTPDGCRIWNPAPARDEAVSWEGACVDGLASGPGVARWSVGGAPTEVSRGTYEHGHLVGEGTWEVACPPGAKRSRQLDRGPYRASRLHGVGESERCDGTTDRGRFERGRLTRRCDAPAACAVMPWEAGPHLGRAGFTAAAPAGCRIWGADLREGVAAAWSGACEDGYASGRGTVTWTKAGKVLAAATGRLRAGYLSGPSTWEVPCPAGAPAAKATYVGDTWLGLADGLGTQVRCDGTADLAKWREGQRRRACEAEADCAEADLQGPELFLFFSLIGGPTRCREAWPELAPRLDAAVERARVETRHLVPAEVWRLLGEVSGAARDSGAAGPEIAREACEELIALYGAPAIRLFARAPSLAMAAQGPMDCLAAEDAPAEAWAAYVRAVTRSGFADAARLEALREQARGQAGRPGEARRWGDAACEGLGAHLADPAFELSLTEEAAGRALGILQPPEPLPPLPPSPPSPPRPAPAR